MINLDGLVLIANYLFNVNLFSEKCYALHTQWLSDRNASYYYNLLMTEQGSSVYIFDFTTDDEVLELLEDANYPIVEQYQGWCGTIAKRCSEPGAKKKKRKGNEYWPEWQEGYADYVKVKVAYQKAGIYFGLIHKVRMHFQYHPWQILTEHYNWKFKPKCGTEQIRTPITSILDARPDGSNHHKEAIYEGSKGLTK